MINYGVTFWLIRLQQALISLFDSMEMQMTYQSACKVKYMRTHTCRSKATSLENGHFDLKH